jgi:hypothetical protein
MKDKHQNETHGHARRGRVSPTYKTWRSMHMRCYRENNPSFDHYGAKGVIVCNRWHTFENFLSDMGERPEGCTIDRVDSNKNYTKTNCRWLNASENSARAQNRYLTFRGKKKTISQLAIEFGIRQDTLHFRVFKAGWDLEKAVTTPTRKYGNA